MTVDFNKYKKYKDYHWNWYKNKTSYIVHVDRIKDWIKEKNVLDVGAGDRLITYVVGIKGVDNDPTAVAIAQEKGADVILGDAHSLPFKDEEFDSVFMGDTLEHLKDPIKALIEARRVLKYYLYLAGPLAGDGLEKYEYQKWTVEELKEKVESVGFIKEEISIQPRKNRPGYFYAKFKKI